MSRVKRWIAFTLAVIMTVGLLPTSLPIWAVEAADVSGEPQVLFTENFDGWIANTNSDVVSTRTSAKNFVWNNADPDNAPAKWSILLEDKNGDSETSAAAKFIYHKTGGYDGGSYLELATSGVGGRAGISCKLSAADYAKFVEGKTYVLRIWVKASKENDISLRVNTVYLTAGNKTTGTEVSKGTQWEQGWVQAEHEFVFSNERGNMTLNIGMNNHATSGSLFIGGITISELDTRKINLSQEDIYVQPGEKAKISYTLENVSAGSKVVFSSDNKSIAKVNSKGEITGVSKGTAVITASIEGSTIKAKCEVHVAPPLLVEESFENWVKNNNTGKVSNSTKTLVWNSAGPAKGSPWSGFTNMDAHFYGNAPDAYDGKYSVAITPNFADTKAGITYTMPADIYDLMEEGAEYAIRVWFKKTEEGAFSGRIQALCLKSGNPQTLPALEEEWTVAEHRFIFSREKGSMGVNLGVYNVTESGTCFIDKMTIEKVLEVDEVTLNKTEAYLKIGDTFKLEYQLFPDNTSSAVSFHSANEEIATVDANGTITAHKTGQTTITVVAAKGNKKAQCQINVVNEIINATSVKINKGTLSLNPGGQQKLSAVFTPAQTTDKSVTWSSSNPSVATVDSQGMVSAYAVGTTVIKVTAGKLTASCTVTVSDASGFTSVNKALKVQFGQKTSIKLKDYLAGSSYRLVEKPKHGKLSLNTATGVVEYTSYTWPTDKANGEFVDKEYQDYVLVAVTNAAGKTALITLNITIGKFGELFDWESIDKLNLFFSQADLNAIKAEIVKNPNGERATLFTNFLKAADNELNKAPVAYDAPDDEYNEDGSLLKQDVSHTNLEQRATGISLETYVIAYLLTKDMKGYEAKNTAYLNKVIECAKASLSYPFWGTRSYVNEDLAAGHQLIGMSLAYHWMKKELSKVTCDHVLGTDPSWNNWTVNTTKNMPMLKAMEERLWYVGRAMYNGNITTTWHIQNHSFVRMDGQLAVAIALAPTADTAEEQQEIVDWAGMVLWRNGTGMNAMMPDGTSQEGLSYWEYGAIRALQASLMAEEAFGIDLLELTQAFRNSDEWIAYNMLPQDHWTSSQSALHFSDSSGSHFSGPSDLLRILAAKYQDSEAQWLAQQVEKAGIDIDSTIWTGVVFADTTLKATAMTNESIAHFKDMDIVISRSDWSGNEDIVAIKTGIPTGKNLLEMYQNGTYLGDPESGHSHADANHITIYANGEYLLRDDRGDVTPKASNHNTLLINEKGQLGEGSNYIQESAFFEKTEFPHIKKVFSCDAYDYIIGDATEAYAESLGLAKFERHIIYIKAEKVLLVVDNVQTYNEQELELRWFPQSKTVVYSAGAYTMKSDKNTMNFFPFTANVETVFEDVTVYGNAGGTAPEAAFRQLYTGTNWQNAVAFSWQDAGSEPNYVSYESGDAGVHRFGFGGQIYSLNVSTAEVTITSGTIANPNLEMGGDDSTLSTVLVNGTVLGNFNPKATEYTIDRWWKTYELDFQCFANSYGAKVSMVREKDKIIATCTSRDGTNSTVYTFTLTNSKNILGIVDVQTSLERYGYDPKWTYDGVITLNNNGKYWTVETDSTGQVSLTYNMKDLVNITQIDLAIQNSKNYNYYYDLCISEDGETWKELKTAAIFEKTEAISLNNHATRTIFQFGSEKARYVKIVLRGRSADETMDYIDKPAWCGVQEITVYGTEYHEHNMQWAPAKEPTCTEPGVSAGMKCTLCDYYETEPTIYPALGHIKEDIPAIPPTCTEPGFAAGKICTRCNKELWVRRKIEPLGGDHKWGEWVYDGLLRTHTCYTCGTTETSSLVPVVVTVVAVVVVGAGGAVTAVILLRRRKAKKQPKNEAEM